MFDWQSLRDRFPVLRIDPRILAGYVLGGIAFSLCLIAAAIVPPNHWLQIVLCLFGGVVGWVIGIGATPLDEKEDQRFTDFAKAISAFVSGFAIAKLGVIGDALAEKVGGTGGEVLLFRTLLFGTCLLLGFLFTVINRLYLQDLKRVYLQLSKETPASGPADDASQQ